MDLLLVLINNNNQGKEMQEPAIISVVALPDSGITSTSEDLHNESAANTSWGTTLSPDNLKAASELRITFKGFFD